MDNIHYKTAAYRVLALELLVTSVLALLLLAGSGTVIAYSAALGGLVFILPNALFAGYAFRHSAADSAELAVRWFMIGEVIKIIVTVLLFAACFTLVRPLNVIVLLAAYLVMMTINLIGVSRIGKG